MVLNSQKRVRVDKRSADVFARKVRRALKLGRKDFGVCFVDDAAIAALNGRFRKKSRPTDVLSFPWHPVARVLNSRRTETKTSWALGPRDSREFGDFLGDIVISAETARRNARAAGHSTAREIRWLILHGALHLLGFDHETDQGEMRERELALRDQLRT